MKNRLTRYDAGAWMDFLRIARLATPQDIQRQRRLDDAAWRRREGPRRWKPREEECDGAAPEGE